MWADKAVDILVSCKDVYSQVHGELSCRFLRISWSLNIRLWQVFMLQIKQCMQQPVCSN